MRILSFLFYKDGLSWDERAKILNQYLIVGIVLILLVSIYLIRQQRIKERKRLEIDAKKRRLKSTKTAKRFTLHVYQQSFTGGVEGMNTLFSDSTKGEQCVVLKKNDEVDSVLCYSSFKSNGVLMNALLIGKEQQLELFFSRAIKQLRLNKVQFLAVYIPNTADTILLETLGFSEVTMGKKEKLERPEQTFWKLKLAPSL